MAIDSNIRSIIDAFGYIKIDEMMRQSMSANVSSYYQSQDSIGASGDFITAPEVSQLFGETVGFWLINKWQELGSPSDFALVELGPGQGTLMYNILRVAKLVPEFLNNLEITLIEINPHFIQKQKNILEPLLPKIRWINNIDDLPKKPSIIISNEFFDALPIKQYIKIRHRWYESVLMADPHDGSLKFDKIELHKALFEQLNHDYKSATDGAVLEESPQSLEIIRKIADHVVEYKGSCLTIDYGYDIDPNLRSRRQYNSTLQAIKGHKYVPIIDSLGEADLSAHVDFYALKNAVMQQGVGEVKIITQAQFLVNYGIRLRQKKLKEKLSDEEAKVLDKQLDRLINAGQMGELFKVMEF